MSRSRSSLFRRGKKHYDEAPGRLSQSELYLGVIDSYDKAILLWKKCRDPHTRDWLVQAYLNRGKLQALQCEDPESISSCFRGLQEAERLDSRLGSVNYIRGLVFIECGEWNPNEGAGFRNLALPQFSTAITKWEKELSLIDTPNEIVSDVPAAQRCCLEPKCPFHASSHSMDLPECIASAYIQRAMVLSMIPDREPAALFDFSRAIEIEPKNSSHYFNRSVFFSKCGRPQRAMDDLEMVAQLSPQSRSERIQVARSYYQLGNHGMGLQHGMAALALETHLDDGTADAIVGRCYTVLGFAKRRGSRAQREMHTRAEVHFLRSVETNSSNKDSAFALSWFYYMTEQWENCIVASTTVLELQGTSQQEDKFNGWALMYRGTARMETGILHEALSDLQASIQDVDPLSHQNVALEETRYKLDECNRRIAEERLRRGNGNSIHGGCEICGTKSREGGERLLRCGRCRCVRYCSTACQRRDWNQHKKVCRRLAAERSSKNSHN